MTYRKDTFYSKNLRISKRFLPLTGLLLSVVILTGFMNTISGKTPASQEVWAGTWSTSPQLVEQRNMPPEPGLSNSTLRQVVCVSIGGENLRVRFSNEFSKSPVTMKKVQIAVSKGESVIDKSTITELKFKGNPEITMDPGVAIISDPVAFKLTPRMLVAITIYFGETSPDVTGHPGSRTTSYLISGDKTSEVDLADAAHTDHWYVIRGIDVKAPKSAGVVAILGNSITDGRGSGTNKQDRWPDELAIRLLNNRRTRNIAVLNQGIGGNCVIRGGLGPTALSRFDRDVINQDGVRWLIIFEGVNDIGGSRGSDAASRVSKGLIEAYNKMIDEAHAHGIKVYGATITPFGKSFYYSPDHEAARDTVNNWIRTSGRFDAVIDFDKVMRDPQNTISLLPEAQSGDFLHPNEKGYVMMGGAVDLKLFK